MAPYEKDAFKFCMVCGSDFETVSNIEKRCKNCGYSYFITSKPSSSAIILNPDHELLLIKRARDPHKGTWDVPAGFCDENETLEDTLIREMKEEINLDVKEYKYLKSYVGDYEYKGVIKKFISGCYIIHLDADQLKGIKPGDDAAEVKWISLDRVDYREIGFPGARQRIKDYITSLK